MRHQTLKQKARQIEILSTLSKLDFLTRRQLQAIHCLGSIRNANRVLKDMHPYCHITKMTREHVYYLNKKGRDLLGITKEVKKSSQLQHILMRNESWMWLGFPEWKTERPIEFSINGQRYRTIPDATYFEDNVPHFVEIDRMQHMKANEHKIQLYGHITDIYKRQNAIVPVINFFTLSDYRQSKLEQYAINRNVFMRTFVMEDIF
ncbi:Replication-relaxation [Bacillus wiedmannii]|uniref:Replication-relaxation n=1 Tax=Bacillus wiedmannii TaxID=1890302 RepID=A0A1G7EZK9_9BACI|nr:replication-relaxation family protein [Bacillus wiedmannii]SDE68906.1 Replication-relaxation [Bacillus wiedmannii]